MFKQHTKYQQKGTVSVKVLDANKMGEGIQIKGMCWVEYKKWYKNTPLGRISYFFWGLFSSQVSLEIFNDKMHVSTQRLSSKINEDNAFLTHWKGRYQTARRYKSLMDHLCAKWVRFSLCMCILDAFVFDFVLS